MSTIYAPKTGLYIPGTASNYISTPDHADLDITGDICWEFSLTPNTASDVSILFQKYLGLDTHRSWRIQKNSASNLTVFWTSLGTAADLKNVSVTYSWQSGVRSIIGITLDVSNAESKYEFRFFSKNAPDSGWVLFNTVIGTTTTSLFSGAAQVEFGYGQSASYFTGVVDYCKIYSGIGNNSQPGLGTLVAEFDASKCKPRYRDSTGKVWSITGSDVVTEKVYHD